MRDQDVVPLQQRAFSNEVTFIFDGCDASGKKRLGRLVPVSMSTGNKPARVAAEKHAGIAGACASRKRNRKGGRSCRRMSVH